MMDAAPCPTPMVVGKIISTFEGERLKNPIVFISAIGTLQYLCNTKQDISFNVNKLSHFLSNPTTLARSKDNYEIDFTL